MSRIFLRYRCVFLFILLGIFIIYFTLSYNKSTISNMELSTNNIKVLDKKEILQDYKDKYYEVLQSLSKANIINVLTYVWCGTKSEGVFEFRHFLALQSVIKLMKPDRVFFYCNNEPTADRYNYNTWWKDLKSTYPWIQVITTNISCSDDTQTMDFIRNRMYSNEGLFIGESTVLTSVSKQWHQSDFMSTLKDPRNGYILFPSNDKRHPPFYQYEKQCTLCHNKHFECAAFKSLEQLQSYEQPKHDGLINRNITCVCLVHLNLQPKSIWNRNDTVSSVFNYIFYDSHQTPSPDPNPNDLVPNIAHMLWIGGREVNFLFYLSALSLLYVVKVDQLYIHGDAEPRGEWWIKLIANEPKVTYIFKPRPNRVFGNRVGSSHHCSDVFRADIMTRYGGIYSDVDAIWTQRPSLEMRSYDAVANLDWAHNYRPYPDYINLGISLGKRHSEFWKLYLESMKEFRDSTFGYNGLLKPYKIYEWHPESLLIYKHLQVMCYMDNCFPLWGKEFNEIDWKRDTYAVHWTYPDPVEYTNMTMLLKSNSTFGDIGKFVLQSAGML